MNSSGLFYLSLLTLILGTGGGIYLLIYWWKDKKDKSYLLFWAIGLFLAFLFQIPGVLVNYGKEVVLSDFSVFYAISASFSFLSLGLIYLGILKASKQKKYKTAARNVFLLVLVMVALVSYYFLIQGAQITDHIIQIVVIFMLFLPFSFAVLFRILKWLFSGYNIENASDRLGVLLVGFGIVLIIIQLVIVALHVLSYPPNFWFFALINLPSVFVLQNLSTILLIIGFLLIA